MAFIQPCFIQKNTDEIRQKLKNLGYDICRNSIFDDAVWHDITTTGTIHSKLHLREDMPTKTKSQKLCFLVTENKKSENPIIDCGENEDLFLALAALKDDSDYMQWFTDGKDWYQHSRKDCSFQECVEHYGQYGTTSVFSDFHKATVAEIIEHFKGKND